MYWYPWTGWAFLCPFFMVVFVVIMRIICLGARRRGHFVFPCCRAPGSEGESPATRLDRDAKAGK